jgi:hypothetical protein
MALYAWDTQARPDFLAATAPILRFARKLLTAAGPGQAHAHGDELTLTELHRIHTRFLASFEAQIPLPGILGVLQSAIHALGWDSHSPTSLITHEHIELDLKVNPPAKARACLIKAFENQQDHQHQRRLPGTAPTLDWHLLRKLVRSKEWNPSAKGTLLQLYAGNILARSWAYEHGYPVDPRCPCGHIDDAPHRLGGCEHTRVAKEPITPEDTVQLVGRLERPVPATRPALRLTKEG